MQALVLGENIDQRSVSCNDRYVVGRKLDSPKWGIDEYSAFGLHGHPDAYPDRAMETNGVIDVVALVCNGGRMTGLHGVLARHRCEATRQRPCKAVPTLLERSYLHAGLRNVRDAGGIIRR
ncbi:MAG: hypothetical protein ABI190_03900 [Casimicrobiaceae bacterium]